MPSERIVSISHNVIWPDITALLEKKRFEFIPAISYVIQDDGPQQAKKPELIYFPKPLSLYEFGLPIELLCKYVGDELEKKEELKVARHTYSKLKRFAQRCADRVVADLLCSLVLSTLNKEADQIIYFVEGPPSDKMLARLSYLYLSLEKITICFITFQREDLVTLVMSLQSGRLEFDIQRLLSSEIVGFQGPYPGISEESLVQTYFYKHPEVRTGGKVSPIRLDILCQGLLESHFEDKKEMIRKKLEDPAWRKSFPVDRVVETFLPMGFIMAIKSWSEFFNQKLEEGKINVK